MREVWRYVSVADTQQQVFEIAIQTDLLETPHVVVRTLVRDEAVETAEYNFRAPADAYEFVSKLRGEFDARGLAQLKVEETQSDKIDPSDALGKLAMLLSVLQPTANQWSSEETERKIGKLANIVDRIRGRPRPIDEQQLELFDDGFAVI